MKRGFISPRIILTFFFLGLVGLATFLAYTSLGNLTSLKAFASLIITKERWEENSSDNVFYTSTNVLKRRDANASGGTYYAIRKNATTYAYFKFVGRRFTLGTAKNHKGGILEIKTKYTGVSDKTYSGKKILTVSQKKQTSGTEFFTWKSDLATAKIPKSQCYEFNVELKNRSTNDLDEIYLDYIDVEKCDDGSTPVLVCKNEACAIRLPGDKTPGTKCSDKIVGDPCGKNVPDEPRKDAVTKKVMVLIYDPILENKGGIRLSEYRDFWIDPVIATQGVIKNVRETSYGYVNYNVVETKLLDEYEEKVDGYRYTDETYVAALEDSSKFYQPNDANYNKILTDNQVCEKVNAGTVDELWLWGGPFSGYNEWTLTGPNAYSHGNRVIYNTTCNRLLPIMGFNYEVGEDNAYHSFGHRIEGALIEVYGFWATNEDTIWNTFTLFDKATPGKARCGNIHNPPNALDGYQYDQKAYVPTSCDDWLAYPKLPPTPNYKQINCNTWGCNAYGFYKWWMRHIPHQEGTTNGKENNWWKYVVDFNAASK